MLERRHYSGVVPVMAVTANTIVPLDVPFFPLIPTSSPLPSLMLLSSITPTYIVHELILFLSNSFHGFQRTKSVSLPTVQLGTKDFPVSLSSVSP